jgi:hypothetical protein
METICATNTGQAFVRMVRARFQGMGDIVANGPKIEGGHGSRIPGVSTVPEEHVGDDVLAGWRGGQNH